MDSYLAVDELDILGALRITVSCSILSSCLVGGIFGQSSISIHLGEVQGTVEATGKIGHIYVEGEFLSKELQKLVLGGASGSHQVVSGSDIGVCSGGHKAKLEGITTGSDAVGALIVTSVESAVCGAGHSIRAEGLVPSVTSVAVRVAIYVVQPPPVCIENDGLGGSRASTCSALTDSQRRVGLCRQGAGLLGTSTKHKGSKSERSSSCHDERMVVVADDGKTTLEGGIFCPYM